MPKKGYKGYKGKIKSTSPINMGENQIISEIEELHSVFEKEILCHLGGIIGQWSNWGLSNASDYHTTSGQNPVAEYIDLSRTPDMVEKKRRMAITKELSLLKSLLEITKMCDTIDFLDAVKIVNLKGLRRPLKNHNYLKQVILTCAHKKAKENPKITRTEGWYR